MFNLSGTSYKIYAGNKSEWVGLRGIWMELGICGGYVTQTWTEPLDSGQDDLYKHGQILS